MAHRSSLALILSCAALAAAPAASQAADLHLRSNGAPDPQTGREALLLAKQLQDGKGVETGRELSPVLRTLAEKLPELSGADRRRAERVLARPTSTREANPGEDTYAVPEAPAVCGTHFCVHYVATTEDAPSLADANANAIPDYVEVMLREFENVYQVENVQMGWRPPKADFGRGGNDLTDVYIKNIGPQGIFGYAAPDARQPATGNKHQLAAYLVMDNDYTQEEYSNYSEFLQPLQVTAAHEYNHVLQFNYDSQQDNWMFESTATWMEDKVYDDINDYRSYLPEWAKLSLTPLTEFDAQGTSNNVKVYGDAVFNRWIDERLGQETIRRAWEVSVATKSFAPGAYDTALRERGSSFFDAFTTFATETAEWRASNGFFEEGDTFPDVSRALGGDPLIPQSASRRRGDFVGGGLNHTAYGLFDVDARGEDRVVLGGTFRRGVPGAIALVGRTGDDLGGPATVRITKLPHGGAGTVTLENATSYSRITAVIVNSDISYQGFSQQIGDWVWQGDDEPITLAVNDFTAPSPSRFTTRRVGRAVATDSSIQVRFNEAVAGVTTRSVRLFGPGDKTVRVKVVQSKNARIVKLTPRRPLARGKRYVVRLSADVTDPGGNAVSPSRRTWRFATAR
jgi:hypothetical protein